MYVPFTSKVNLIPANVSLPFPKNKLSKVLLKALTMDYSFTPKSDQLKFSLSVSHQRYNIQYGELGI